MILIMPFFSLLCRQRHVYPFRFYVKAYAKILTQLSQIFQYSSGTAIKINSSISNILLS